jgi:hypothetical protein
MEKIKNITSYMAHHLIPILLFAVVASVIFYVYFVNQTILNVVLRENLEQSIVEIQSEISELEFNFITEQKELDMQFALANGFNEIETPLYISRDTTQNLSLGQGE